MALFEVNFQSFNQRDTIKGWIYTPIVKPKAIVQIVHGLGEHSRRYMHMILKLNEAGFIVCADDHAGHGKTAYDSGIWGDAGNKGYMTTAEDEQTLRKLVTKQFPGLPYIFYGHSWGSMIVRNYITKYGEDLAGAIFCGTTGMFINCTEQVDELKALVDQGKGDERQEKYLVNIFKGMTDRFENPNSPNDWIANDPNIVADHASDPFNNLTKPYTVQFLYDFCYIAKIIIGESWAKKVPVKLPIYNIAGDQDPVGDYGEGVYKVSNWLCEAGHRNVATKLYSGYRHEIHNERAIRDEVVDGMINFINSII